MEIYNKLKEISITENIDFNNELINNIIKLSCGDLRKAINFFQKSYYSNNILDDISGYLPKNIFDELILNHGVI